MQLIFTVRPEIESVLQRIGDAIGKGLSVALKQTVLGIEAQGVKEAPVKTSNLVNSITSYIAGLTGVVKATAPYAVFVHEGTARHTIAAGPGKALYWPGAAHPVKSVKHPGTKANPFFLRAEEKTDPPGTFNTILGRYLSGV